MSAVLELQSNKMQLNLETSSPTDWSLEIS